MAADAGGAYFHANLAICPAARCVFFFSPVPAGVLNVLSGGAEVAKRLVENPIIRKVDITVLQCLIDSKSEQHSWYSPFEGRNCDGPRCRRRRWQEPRFVHCRARRQCGSASDNYSHVVLFRAFGISQTPIVVFDDADIESAVNGVAFSAFIASGQTCVSGTRLILQYGIWDTFMEKLYKKVDSITNRIGNRKHLKT